MAEMKCPPPELAGSDFEMVEPAFGYQAGMDRDRDRMDKAGFEGSHFEFAPRYLALLNFARLDYPVGWAAVPAGSNRMDQDTANRVIDLLVVHNTEFPSS